MRSYLTSTNFSAALSPAADTIPHKSSAPQAGRAGIGGQGNSTRWRQWLPPTRGALETVDEQASTIPAKWRLGKPAGALHDGMRAPSCRTAESPVAQQGGGALIGARERCTNSGKVPCAALAI